MSITKELKIQITAEDNLTSVIKKVGDALGETGLGQAITAASTAFLALNQAASIVSGAIGKVTGAFSTVIDAASEAEQSTRKLTTSMVLAGAYTSESQKEIEAWAGAVQRATGISDEAAQDTVSFALTLGMSAEQAKEAAKAAIDFGKATGMDANTALRQLNGTLVGSIGRMAQLVPELATMTKAQLANGEAITLVAKKFDGFAAKTSQTYAGAMLKAHEAAGDVLEGLGNIIIKNPAVISAIESVAAMFTHLAETLKGVNTWLQDHSGMVNRVTTALGAAIPIVAAAGIGWLVFANYTTVAKVAMLAFKAAMAGTPLGWAVLAVTALTAAFAAFNIGIDDIVGNLKIGLGGILLGIGKLIEQFIPGLAALVGVFNKDLAVSLENAHAKFMGFGADLVDSGVKQLEMAEATRIAAEAMNSETLAIKGMEDAAKLSNQQLTALGLAFGKALSIAQPVIDSLKEFAPRLNLDKMEEEARAYKKQLDDLKTKAEQYELALRVKIQAPTDADKAQIAQIHKAAEQASLALKALELKQSTELRQARVKEVELELQEIRNKTIATSDELMLKRIEGADQLRQERIKILTEEILLERNARAQQVDVDLAAKQEAQKRELQIYTEGLNAQMAAAISIEAQKQAALTATVKNVTGADPVVKAQIQAQEEIRVQQEKIKQLRILAEQGAISEDQFDAEVAARRAAMRQSINNIEIAERAQKIEMLGLSEQALKLKQLEDEKAYQEQLRLIKENVRLTDEERDIAVAQAKQNHVATMTATEEQFYQDQITRAQKTRDGYAQFYAELQLAQAQHGAVMGTLVAVANSQQMAAMKSMFSTGAQLMSSGNKTMFEIGKASAIAQATIQTYQGAVGAYTGMIMAFPGPIGVALGAVAAAAAVAAGLSNIAKISAQKFSPPKGGQADEGIDSVPTSMAGKSFILSAGERVLQPEANKEITAAAEKINNGQGGLTFNATFNVGNTDQASVMKLKDQVIGWVREASERGTKVINNRGVYQ